MDRIKQFFKDAVKTSEVELKQQGYTGTTKKDKLKAKYPEISYEQYEKDILRIRRIYTKKRKKTFSNFFDWYLNQWDANGETRCAYCGVTEKQCREFLQKHTKRVQTRSQHLEVEKVDSDKDYKEENCCLICYVCNNTKSDFMSLEQFQPIAKEINNFWHQVLNEDIPFPDWKKLKDQFKQK